MSVHCPTRDSLALIAGQYLDSQADYLQIVQLNQQQYPQLLDRPELIQPGWQLQLPCQAQSESAPDSDSSEQPASTNQPSDTDNVQSQIDQTTLAQLQSLAKWWWLILPLAGLIVFFAWIARPKEP